MKELDILLEKAILANATDIHIQEAAAPRMRIDGQLAPIPGEQAQRMSVIVKQILDYTTDEERPVYEEKLAAKTDVDCAFTCLSGSRVRANIYRGINGLQCALRLIPVRRLTADDIGIPFQVADISMARNGLFLITGANGSGKTTTLAAMLDLINSRRNGHILTIEEPVEYLIKNQKSLVTQREIGLHAPSFYDALRSSTRENPDVVVIGEMRDLRTTQTAIELAETGRLVLATLHARNAMAAVDRIVGQFHAQEQSQIRTMLSENIIGILSQTLLAKRHGGLIAAFELLLATPAVRNLIREQKTPQLYTVMQTGGALGMTTMEDSLIKLVERGTVTPEEAMSKAPFRSNLLRQMENSPLVDKAELRNLTYKDL